MQTRASVSLELAGILMRVHADVALSPNLVRLKTAWGSCIVDSINRAPDTEIFAFLDHERGEATVRTDEWVEQGEFAPEKGHFAIERALYAELDRLLPAECQMLHAGAVMHGERGFLFVGPSGAGKSSLCLAAVRDGAHYLADDIVTTNGREIFGVARAIQFEPPKTTTPFPVWLESSALDFSTYGHLTQDDNTEGDDCTTPLYIPGKERTLPQASARAFATVVLERGAETHLNQVSRVEGLVELVGASFRRNRAVDLGPLLSRGAYRLVWRDPHEAWYKLSRIFP